jgi:hypothetical protein
MMMSSSPGEQSKPRARLQRTVRIDFNASIYDELEELAVERDEGVHDVVRRAVASHLRESRSDGFISG